MKFAPSFPRHTPPRSNPIAHAYVVPVENHPLDDDPDAHWWRIILPVCPICGRQHYHGGGGVEHNLIPFDLVTRSAGHRVPHCSPWSFVDRRWSQDRFDAAYRAAGEMIALAPQYELIIDLTPPLKELRAVPPRLRYESWLALPSNGGCLARDEDVY